MRAWLDIRPGEWRGLLWSFTTLALILSSHAILETARDALFLASLPAERLPFVYLAMAAIGLLFTRFHWPVRAATLTLSLSSGAVITLGMWLVVSGERIWSLYMLYIWSGLFATASVVQLWIYVGAHFTSGEGKRLFGLIGTGGIVGAIVGSLIARAVTEWASASALLPAASGFMILGALAPIGLKRALAVQPESPSKADGSARLRSSFRFLLRHRYIRSLGLLILVATIAVTLADYVFKSIVAEELTDAGELAEFFATFYTLTNIASLVFQLALTPLILRYLGLSTALLALPVLMVGGGVGIMIGGGLVAASAFKGIDGSFRHSLFRTAIEVLYLPLGRRLREAAKMLVDIVGQRGGQAIGSIAILVAVAVLPDSRVVLLSITIGLFAVWVVLAIVVRRENLELFRETLSEDSIETRIEFPELDMASLEVLITKLNSLNEREVRAAMTLLAENDRGHLVPDLILFHPSSSVVIAAFRLFRAQERRSFLPIARHLVQSQDPKIRAAALLALDAVADEATELARYRGSNDVWLAAAAMVADARKKNVSKRMAKEIAEELRPRDPDADAALASAALLAADVELVPLFVLLAKSPDPRARKAVVLVARQLKPVPLIEAIMPLVAERELRNLVRTTLVDFGQPALEALTGALHDTELDPSIRHHLPRTISRFEASRAFPILFDVLPREADEVVQYKILRGLGRLRAEAGELAVDYSSLSELIDSQIHRAVELFAARQALSSESAEPELDLLRRLVQNKHRRALEIVFRLIGLEHAGENVEEIYDGVQSEDRRIRDSARELLGSLLDRNEGPLLVLLDERSDEATASALSANGEEDATIDEMITTLCSDTDPVIAAVAAACVRRVAEVAPQSEDAP